MAKTKEPRTGIVSNADRKSFPAYIPADVRESMRRATLQESISFGRRVTENEFVVRAIIDRVGKVFGTRFANRLYRQYFNGIGPLKHDPKELPEIKTLDIQFIGNNE